MDCGSVYSPMFRSPGRCCSGDSGCGSRFMNGPDIGLDSRLNSTITSECDLIEVVNNLQTKLAASGHSLEVSLPQIVVVGSQSAGKSSVLENIVGKEFLPRGSGVVTRRPIIVQLNPCDKEYAVFAHKPGESYTDFVEVRNEIARATMESAGRDGFSSIPIQLQIYSPNVLKLTLVDLPGLVKVPMGDQPDSIVDEVREMVMRYIEQPKSLILAVSPANQDLANSDALNIAKKVDPERIRTIGVLTKLDIMDQGTDARDVLENKLLSLRRGYVGVINRSQKDIDDGKDVPYVLEKEKKFFQNHPAYKHLANRMGTPYLQQVLQKQLQAHIKEHLCEVRQDLRESYASSKKKLNVLNEKLGIGGDGKRLLMIRLVQQFIDSMKLKLVGQSEEIDLKKISPGAHINYLMYTNIQDYLNLELTPNNRELTVAIANIPGFRTGIAVPSLAVDAICRNILEKYKEPVQKSVSTIAKVVLDAVKESAKEIDEYPTLKNELNFKLETYIRQQEDTTKEILMKYVEAEMYSVNIGHPDFESSELENESLPIGPVKIWKDKKNPLSDSSGNNDDSSELLEKLLTNEATQKQVQYVSATIRKYLEIVRKTVGDITIKYTLYFLIKGVLNFLNFNLMAELAFGNVDTIMQDCEDDIRKQDELEMFCCAIHDALETIQSF